MDGSQKAPQSPSVTLPLPHSVQEPLVVNNQHVAFWTLSTHIVIQRWLGLRFTLVDAEADSLYKILARIRLGFVLPINVMTLHLRRPTVDWRNAHLCFIPHTSRTESCKAARW